MVDEDVKIKRAAKRAAARAKLKAEGIRPVVKPAKVEARHRGLFFSFLGMVVLPLLAAAFYLFAYAEDQYSSTVGFTVRSGDTTSASDLIGGLGAAFGTSGGGADTDILYEFVRSQELVRRVDERLDLRGLYARHWQDDPLMSFNPEGSIEDLTRYWGRMLRISYDASSGLMELRVLAFGAEDAQKIALTILDESAAMINDLASQARVDATRYARQDLAHAEEELVKAREALTAFRLSSQIVDPAADIQGQVGLLNTLQSQLADALIAYDLLLSSVQAGDPRIATAERRIEVIQNRISQERGKFGSEGQDDEQNSYAVTVAGFERLLADREFAEMAYTAARTAYDAAVAESQRRNRYLATYITPSVAERSLFPQRGLIILVIGLFAFLIWAILSLIYYSLRDRR